MVSVRGDSYDRSPDVQTQDTECLIQRLLQHRLQIMSVGKYRYVFFSQHIWGVQGPPL